MLVGLSKLHFTKAHLIKKLVGYGLRHLKDKCNEG